MPWHCCVSNCTANSKNCKGLKWHQFPHNPKLRRKWMKIIKTHKATGNWAKVCSRHFTDDDYFVSSIGDNILLKKTAVPSRNLSARSTNKPNNIRLSRTSKNTDYALSTNNDVPDKQLTFTRPTAAFLETQLLKRLGPMRSDCIACGLRNIPDKIAATGITFHSFPKEPSLCEAWVNACGRPNWVPSPCSFLCSQHFTEEDFVNETSDESIVQLRENAVPTVFKTTPSHLQASKITRNKSPDDERNAKVSVISAPFKNEPEKVAPNVSQVFPANLQKVEPVCEVPTSACSVGELLSAAAFEISEPCDQERECRESEYVLPHNGFNQETEQSVVTCREKLLNEEILRLRKENAALSDELCTLKDTLNSMKMDQARSQKIIAKYRLALTDSYKKVNEDGG